ncbi:DENN domain-containing protein 1A-like isoform X1 [Petromyzon marinus]|uniref:DENN domain-containing protein 1A-like isoform X1 n=1 Tax=Petromyzon marinus TaxID=7757 RepID=UPI003F717FC2
MGSRIRYRDSRENPERIFEVFVEVSCPVSTGDGAEVLWKYPEDYYKQDVLGTIPKFCFPFDMTRVSLRDVGQSFTFVLTDVSGTQSFGICRMCPASHTCLALLSYLPWFDVFHRLLNTLAEHINKAEEGCVQQLLLSLHEREVPEPGMPLQLTQLTYFISPDLRELPTIPENRNLTEFTVAVDVPSTLQLYASLLNERRIIVTSSKISTLSSCIHALALLLYPMSWQHVYIPLLPPHLLEYCSAPMPFLIGVHSSLMDRVRTMPLDDAIVFTIDTNTMETPFNDLQGLPSDVVAALRSRLKRPATVGDGVARAFLKSQAALYGSYREALRFQPGEPITFSEDAFACHRSTSMRSFLTNATHMQIFKQFIEERLERLNAGSGFNDVFEEEINRSETEGGATKSYNQWLTTVKKGGGAIFQTVKSKANPAVKSVYKFAREQAKLAKDQARMGIQEVKSRLKQKEGSSVDDFSPQEGPATFSRLGEPWASPDHDPSPTGAAAGAPPGSNGDVADPKRTSLPSPDVPYFLEDSGSDPEDSAPGFPDTRLLGCHLRWCVCMSQPYRSLDNRHPNRAERSDWPAEAVRHQLAAKSLDDLRGDRLMSRPPAPGLSLADVGASLPSLTPPLPRFPTNQSAPRLLAPPPTAHPLRVDLGDSNNNHGAKPRRRAERPAARHPGGSDDLVILDEPGDRESGDGGDAGSAGGVGEPDLLDLLDPLKQRPSARDLLEASPPAPRRFHPSPAVSLFDAPRPAMVSANRFAPFPPANRIASLPANRYAVVPPPQPPPALANCLQATPIVFGMGGPAVPPANRTFPFNYQVANRMQAPAPLHPCAANRTLPMQPANRLPLLVANQTSPFNQTFPPANSVAAAANHHVTTPANQMAVRARRPNPPTSLPLPDPGLRDGDVTQRRQQWETFD